VNFFADFMRSVGQKESISDHSRIHSVFAGRTTELAKILTQERLPTPYRICYKSCILRAAIEPFDHACFKLVCFIITPNTRRALAIAASCDQMGEKKRALPAKATCQQGSDEAGDITPAPAYFRISLFF
jgi:hypothetical protein